MRWHLKTNAAKIAMFSFPFWTLPFLPGSFRPLISYFIFIFGFMYIINGFFYMKKYRKEDFFILSFLIFSVFHSVLMFSFYGGNVSVWINSVGLLFIGVISYFGYRYILTGIEFDKIVGYFKLPIYALVIIGWLEVLSSIGVLPFVIKSVINTLLAGKEVGRIGLTTSEPAWASRLCVFIIPITYYLYKVKGIRLMFPCLISLLLFFVMTFSLSGVVVVLGASVIYLFIFKFRIRTFINISLVILVLSLALSSLYINFKSDEHYYITRFEKIDKVDISDLDSILSSLSVLDGSAFIRTAYPVVSFRVFFDNPLGVGVGRYGEYFENQISRFGYTALKNAQVQRHISDRNADQRSYYGKIISETGIIGLLLILIFYIRIIRVLKRSKNDINKNTLLSILLSIMLANMLQFASYIMPIYWLIPAMVLNYADEK